MKFKLYYKDPNQPQPIWSNKDRLADFDYELVGYEQYQNPENLPQPLGVGVDFVLVHQELVSVGMLESTQAPVIILERIDGAQLGTSRRFLSHPKVLGVIKNTTFVDPQKHNQWGGRHHVDIYRDTMGLPKLENRIPNPQLTEKDLAKIELGYSYCAYERLGACFDVPWKVEDTRPNVYCFMGTVNYGEESVTSHRRSLLTKLSTFTDWPGICEGQRFVHNTEYANLLVKSKICVSPWGYGEACYRDYEALATGCIVIKPSNEYVKSDPDIFRDGSLISCSPDWRDLSSVIQNVLNHWESLSEFRLRNSEKVREARRPVVICQKLSEIFSRCLQRKLRSLN